jgi:hypothetical protein
MMDAQQWSLPQLHRTAHPLPPSWFQTMEQLQELAKPLREHRAELESLQVKML